MSGGVAPPVLLGTHRYADARAPREVVEPIPSILYIQLLAEQIDSGVLQRYTHRVGDVARTFAEVVIGNPRRARRVPRSPRSHSAPPHQRDSVERLERADEHRSRRIDRFGDDVYEIVDAVIEVHIGMSRWSVHRNIAFGSAGSRVARRIRFPDIRLDLNDDPRGQASPSAVNQNFSE